jgi:DNA repair protein RecO (recombination protein O)
MDESRHTKAIILNRSDYRESDYLVKAYTENFGSLTLLAKGAKKLSSKLAAHLEPMNLVKILIINGRGFDYIAAATISEARLGIREDLNKIFYAGKIIALFSSLVKEEEKDGRLFSLLNKYFEVIDAETDFNKEKGALFLIRFTLSLLSELGYKPEMKNCLHCGTKIESGANYFDLKGGLICENCRAKSIRPGDIVATSDNCIKIIRHFLNPDLTQKLSFSKKLINEMEVLLRKFVLFLK